MVIMAVGEPFTSLLPIGSLHDVGDQDVCSSLYGAGAIAVYMHGIKCSDALFQDKHLLRTVLSAGLLLFGLIIGAVGSLLEVHLLPSPSLILLKRRCSDSQSIGSACFVSPLNRPVLLLIRMPAWG